MTSALTFEQLVALLGHFMSLSLFATGGAMALASDMHRYVVDEHHYISHEQFISSIAIAQASPGPNIMFVTVMGWQIGGFAGALATSLGILTPVLFIPFIVMRIGGHPRFERVLEAFKRGLAPVAIGFMAATVWLLTRQVAGPWTGVAMAVTSLAILAFTPVPPVVVILGFGVIGAFLPWDW